jgi:hypothetical protein
LRYIIFNLHDQEIEPVVVNIVKHHPAMMSLQTPVFSTIEVEVRFMAIAQKPQTPYKAIVL